MIFFALVLAFSFITAGLASGVLTWLVREVAASRNWATPPRSKRHIHTVAIPRLGGVAIFGAFFFVGLLALGILRSVSSPHLDLPSGRLLGITVPATLLFIVGLADDIRPLSVRVKLLFQVISATYLFLSGIRAFESEIVLRGHNVGPLLSFAFTVIWVIGISNAVNIIDGMDGLAAGSALFSVSTVFIMALTGSNYSIALGSIILAGSLLGFLRFNFNPATIFLGDCGSLFIGFLLSSLALAGRHTSAPAAVAVAVPVVALGLPITETAVSITRRLLRGTGIFAPDRRHFHHRLLDLGFTQKQAVSLLYAFSAVCALASIFLMYPDPLTTGFSLMIVGGIVVFGIQKLGYVEFGEFGRIARRTIEQGRVITNNVQFRCAAQEITRAKNMDAVYSTLRQTIERAGMLGFDLFINQPDASRGIDEKRSSPDTMRWWRPGTSELTSPIWTLSIQLVSDEFGEVGLISIHGPIGAGQMLFDTNVLLADLQPALSDSVARLVTKSRNQNSTSRPKKEAVLAAAGKSNHYSSRPN